MKSIERELQSARNNLLDLSMRNRLLNFHPTTKRTIRVIDEIPREIYDFLVINEKTMEFKAKPKQSKIIDNHDSEYKELDNRTKYSNVLKADANISTVQSRHLDKYLQTILENEDLEKNIQYISQQSQSFFEEQGYTVLYIALGFLEWREDSGSIDSRKAPLVLIPVSLDQKSVGDSFKLSWTGEDIFTNISLQSQLSKLGVLFPEFEMPLDKNGIDVYFESVRESVSKKNDWKVLNDIYLGFFSFTKFVMYKDLDPNSWSIDRSPKNNPLISSIFNPGIEENTHLFLEHEIDLKLKSKNLYHVMDADPSQIAVIEDVKSGSNLVVEGPPGTGKSQTITNIIAELLASGKTVLFVSEKMAALEVVKSRLDEVGLGAFCLELHSRKSNKKDVLKELQNATYLSSPRLPSENNQFEKLELLKIELNDYATALREPFGSMDRSPYNLFCMKESALTHFNRNKRTMQIVKFNDVEKCTSLDWNAAISSLSNISNILSLVKPLKNHQWKGCQPGEIFPSDEAEIKNLITECQSTLDQIVVDIGNLSQYTSVKRFFNLRGAQSAIEAAKVIALSKSIDKNVLMNEEWNTKNAKVEQLIQQIKDFQNQKFELRFKFVDDAFDQGVDTIIKRYSELLSNDIVKFLDTRFIGHEWKTSTSQKLKEHDKNELKRLVDNCQSSFDNLEYAIDQICEICSVKRPLNLEQIQSSIHASKILAASKPIEMNVLLNEEWNSQNTKAELLIQLIKEYRKKEHILNSRFVDDAFAKDIDSLIKQYKGYCAGPYILRIFNTKYHSLKREISLLYKSIAPKKSELVITDLNELSQFIRLKEDIRRVNNVGISLFGSYWKNEESSPEDLEVFGKWIIEFRQELLRNSFDDRVFEKISSGVSKGRIESIIENIVKFEDSFIKQCKNLADYVGIESKCIFSADNHILMFEQIDSVLNSWVDVLSELQKWISFSSRLYNEGIAPDKAELIVSDLNELSLCIQLRNDIRSINNEGSALFGTCWKNEDSNLEDLESFGKWMVEFRQQFLNNSFDNSVFDKINLGVSKDEIEKSIQNLLKDVELLEKRCNKLFERLGTDSKKIFVSDLDLILFDDLDSKLKLWKESTHKLQEWGRFTVIRNECLNTFASPIINLIDSDALEANDVVSCFEGNFAESFLKNIFLSRETLVNFMGELHEKKIEEFVELDNKMILLNRKRLAYILHSRKPAITGGVSRNSEAGILLGEFSRKRKHMPIRKLMSNCGNLIQKIKPCFMMSPLSIAQFLDPLNIHFDVVVFDEASQVKPEGALGALLRAKQAVIIGDTKQLPPTSFFDKVVDSNDDLEEDVTSSVSDIESILHLCKRSFSTKTLRWHYRSKHDSLIAVSNQEFYDNNLVFYPSPINDPEQLGLKFVHLPETIYDRGGTSTNRMEAQAIAQAAIEHYRTYPEKSLGIGTFNIKQQQAIQEEIYFQLEKNPQIIPFFEKTRFEHFFIKNLETIQGDERDVIFVSVCFGFDSKHNLSMNFGALNLIGGERRLNVLITRAREKCVVFANFKANDLAIDTSSSLGLKSLKVFLDFAENRSSVNCKIMDVDNDDSSSLEESVYEFLTNCGYEVHKRVGCAAYKVDLAVVNPASPNNYILGIEFDGIKYQSSLVARERDRLRQQVLESLYWRIFHIWSTDWYRNHIECQNRLIKAVEDAKHTSPVLRQVIKAPAITKSEFKYEFRELDKQTDSTQNLETYPEKDISKYKVYSNTSNDYIFELSQNELEKLVVNVVDIEGPIHIEELIKRIRTNNGFKRTGYKIKDSILNAINTCENKGSIIRKEDFFFDRNSTVNIRKRDNSNHLKIEHICDQEIELGIIEVLKNQFSTSPDELVVQTSKLLGFKSTGEQARMRITNIISQMIVQKKVRKLLNGRVELI